jgi:hypothetical protein
VTRSGSSPRKFAKIRLHLPVNSNAHLARKNVSCEIDGDMQMLRGCLPKYFKQLAQESVAALSSGNQIAVISSGPPDIHPINSRVEGRSLPH